MQNRFTTFRRGTMFYCEDRTTGQQKSLLTKDETEASKIIQAKNDAVNQPLMNLVMAKTYLAAKDPKLITRTWADVMERFCKRDKKPTRIRHERVVRTKLIPASEIERFLKDTLE
jgi:hypothetical protein